jgi:hypothetical protein
MVTVWLSLIGVSFLIVAEPPGAGPMRPDPVTLAGGFAEPASRHREL